MQKLPGVCIHHFHDMVGMINNVGINFSPRKTMAPTSNGNFITIQTICWHWWPRGRILGTVVGSFYNLPTGVVKGKSLIDFLKSKSLVGVKWERNGVVPPNAKISLCSLAVMVVG